MPPSPSRRLFSGALALLPVVIASSARAQTFAQSSDMTLWARLVADLSGRTTYALTSGAVWGFRPQADDVALSDFAKRLYGYTNLVARKIVRQSPERIAIRTRSWTFYSDPQTGAAITELLNPYTGSTVPAKPMSSSASEEIYEPAGQVIAAPFPVEMARAKRFFDMRTRTVGPHAWVSTSRFTRLRPGSISWWKLEGDLSDYACRTADLADPSLSHIPSTWSHNIVAEWQTWMDMHGTPGHILFKGAGACLDDPGQLPAPVRQTIVRHFPGALEESLTWDGAGR